MEESYFREIIENPSSLGVEVKIRKAMNWTEMQRIRAQIHLLAMKGNGNKIKFMAGSGGEFLIYDGKVFYVYYPQENTLIKFII